MHVVYNTGAQNVSDAQILAMIDQINKDWSKTNTDVGSVPSVWQSITSDMQIQFCLAKVDPSGAATTGIIHMQTASTSFTPNNDYIKSPAQGDVKQSGCS